ncbi:lipoprotein [Bacillus sp. CECT 9360]|nr:lipoprotein [Bacillus sp. CECT 9360]CAH0346771.1 hypothetical protein BCI9360_03117 [Bacillus sp. CECT 9360]
MRKFGFIMLILAIAVLAACSSNEQKASTETKDEKMIRLK